MAASDSKVALISMIVSAWLMQWSKHLQEWYTPTFLLFQFSRMKLIYNGDLKFVRRKEIISQPEPASTERLHLGPRQNSRKIREKNLWQNS
jgi:hypothetical protein